MECEGPSKQVVLFDHTGHMPMRLNRSHAYEAGPAKGHMVYGL